MSACGWSQGFGFNARPDDVGAGRLMSALPYNPLWVILLIMNSGLSLLEKYKDFAPIFIRLIVGFHLVYGTQDNVFSYARMEEFADFLRARAVPFPLVAAFISAYAQFACGILFIIGLLTRYAAVVMVINFIAALVIAHRGDTYASMFPALMMLSGACFLALNGAGRPSVDAAIEKRGKVSQGTRYRT